MSEYTNIAIVSVGTMFFLAWMGWKFIENSNNKSSHQGAGVGLLGASFVIAWLSVASSIEIVDTALPASIGLQNELSQMYMVLLVISILIFIYLALVIIGGSATAAIKRKKLGLGDD